MDTEKYAKALFNAFETKNKKEFDDFFKKFISLIKEKKQQSFLPKIYKEVQKQVEILDSEMKTTLILKDKKDLDTYKERFEKLKEYFDLENLNIEEDKNIIGGFILKNKNHTVDHSFRTKLLKMYNNLIKK